MDKEKKKKPTEESPPQTTKNEAQATMTPNEMTRNSRANVVSK